MTRKLALIIGNHDYQDPTLARLVTPGQDALDLAKVLGDPEIGEFDDVITLINDTAANVRLEVEAFFADKKPDDLLLMYFSGHGIRDDQGRLYLAVHDTRPNRLRATALPAAFITEGMDHSRSRRQILVLDCCHSGSFAQGSKGHLGESVGTKVAFEGVGYGRVVLTATDATQYAWEGERVIGQAEHSVFTHFMVEGLRTGAADINGDGRITLDELYDYVYQQVVTQTPKQTPGKWSYRQQGELVVAKNPRPPIPQPMPLPPELRQLIESPVASAREAAVHELSQILNGSVPGLVLAAEAALTHLAEDDSRRVAQAAAEHLAAHITTPLRPTGVGPLPVIPVAPSDRLAPQLAAIPPGEVAPASLTGPTITTRRAVAPPVRSLWKLLLLTAVGAALGSLAGPFLQNGARVMPIAGTCLGFAAGLLWWRTDLPIAWRMILTIGAGWAFGAMVGAENIDWAVVRLSAITLAGCGIALVGWRKALIGHWKHLAIGASGWAIGGLIGSLVGGLNIELDWGYWAYVGWSGSWVVAGLIGGLTVGLVRRRADGSIRGQRLLLLAGAWALAPIVGETIRTGLGSAISTTLGSSSFGDAAVPAFAKAILAWDMGSAILGGIGIPDAILQSGIRGAVGGAMAGLLGGWATALILRPADQPLDWRQIQLSGTGWGIAWAVGMGTFRYAGIGGQFTDNWVIAVGLVIGGLAAGVVGSLTMLPPLDRALDQA